MHQTAIDEWNGLLAHIAVVRPGVDHPEANAFLDAMHQHAAEQVDLMSKKKAEADAAALAAAAASPSPPPASTPPASET